MTEQTTIAVTACDATYTIAVDGHLMCTDFIRYCAHLAKAQGYMLPSIAEALEEVAQETREELDLEV